MIRRPPRSTLSSSSAASDVYKRQGMALGGVAMIMPTAGFWGTLLKKNKMVKVYFYVSLMEVTALLVFGTYCIIYKDEVKDYVNEHYQAIKNNMPTDVCDCGTSACSGTAAEIAACKSDMTSKLESTYLGLGIMSIITACFMGAGVLFSLRLLRWARLTTPILEGGSVAGSLLAIVLASASIYSAAGGGWSGAKSVQSDIWGLYLAAATGLLIVIAGIAGFICSRKRLAGVLSLLKLLHILCACLLVAAGVTCLYQASALDSVCKDNFESGDNLRSEQKADFCDLDDLVGVVTNCNTAVSTYYDCTTGSEVCCTPKPAFEQLCLSSHQCCSKLLGQTVLPSLWACGCFCFFLILFVIVGFLAATTKIKEILAEEALIVRVETNAMINDDEGAATVGVAGKQDVVVPVRKKNNEGRA
eukprot:TRINITY_DN9440_c0_g1_i1.p1 TRINITY_DN9440_c0_g1~~TRINITY_DN9440_c0_g1_i1.p1  ORF type:complete len:416 (-),score=101.15 TRINITY_DN9440_c0_g1_i1:129-1376(-)